MANFVEIDDATNVIMAFYHEWDSTPEPRQDGWSVYQVLSMPEGCNHYVEGMRFDIETQNMLHTQKSTNWLCRDNLRATDWKVSRHRDQIDNGISTSLTEEEYQALLLQRQTWRDQVVE